MFKKFSRLTKPKRKKRIQKNILLKKRDVRNENVYQQLPTDYLEKECRNNRAHWNANKKIDTFEIPSLDFEGARSGNNACRFLN